MILSYLEIISILFVSYLVLFLIKKLKVFKNFQKDLHQNFTIKKFVLPIGGYYLIISIFILNYLYLSLEISYFILIFFIGALSDLKKFNSPKFRLLAQSVVILLFVYHSQIELSSTRIDILDNLLKNNFFNIFFLSFCILIVMNGTNFIDGLNGLVLLYFLSISLILLNSELNLQIFENKNFINQLILILLAVLILNIFNKLHLGDGGSYLVGFLFSAILIKIYLINQYISPFFIILLLWYPCFENLFSIIRKYRYKKSPIKPDTKHLHQLIFYYLNSKFKFKNNLINNNLSSLIIIFFNLITFFIGLNYITKTNSQIFLIIFNLCVYLLIYSKLFKYRFKNLRKQN